jgi:hypothetical protein
VNITGQAATDHHIMGVNIGLHLGVYTERNVANGLYVSSDGAIDKDIAFAVEFTGNDNTWPNDGIGPGNS